MPAFSMHMRTHNQNCKCNYCGKTFSRPWLLQGHLRTHTGNLETLNINIIILHIELKLISDDIRRQIIYFGSPVEEGNLENADVGLTFRDTGDVAVE